MLEEDADVASSLEILLSTTPGERVMQPLYGCNLSELVFEIARHAHEDADGRQGGVGHPVLRAARDAGKRDLDDSIELEGVVLIEVVYRVKTTNSRFNFVYPYYKQEGTDINLTTTVNLLPDDD